LLGGRRTFYLQIERNKVDFLKGGGGGVAPAWVGGYWVGVAPPVATPGRSHLFDYKPRETTTMNPN